MLREHVSTESATSRHPRATGRFSEESAAARRLAVEQRAWVVDVTAVLLTELGRPRPRDTAEVLLMLRTGAVYAAGLDRSPSSDTLFLQAWDEIVDGGLRGVRPSVTSGNVTAGNTEAILVRCER